jgi:hypothetical protein
VTGSFGQPSGISYSGFRTNGVFNQSAAFGGFSNNFGNTPNGIGIATPLHQRGVVQARSESGQAAVFGVGSFGTSTFSLSQSPYEASTSLSATVTGGFGISVSSSNAMGGFQIGMAPARPRRRIIGARRPIPR